MLFQPSNIYPSTFSGIGAGTVDVTQGINVSWQVNGDTPMTAYQIKIYQNDSGSTLMYDSGSVSVSPVFEPHDKNGNATYFTAIISAAALSTAGIVNGYQYGYKMLITQWWGVSDYVEQTSASVFITRSTPTLAINTITTPVASSSLTITANYSQAQGDPISTVEWVFALAGSESTPIRKTGAISTQVLSFDADGLITGNTYSIMCNVVTSTGMEASTGFVQFPVSYSSSSLGINYQLAQLKNSSAVYLSWDDLGSNKLAYPYTDTTKTTNGITFTVNGEGDVVATGTASADAYFTIAQGTLSQLGITAGQKFIVTSGYSGAKIVVTETNSSNVVVSTITGSDPLQYIATSTTNTLKFSIVIPSGSVLSSGQQLKPMIAIEDKIVALNDLSVTMQPIQSLHGYSSPWPAGGGKNKLDIEERTITTNSEQEDFLHIYCEGCTATKNGGSITVTNTGSWSKLRIKFDTSKLINGQTYTLSALFTNPNAQTVLAGYNDGSWHASQSSTASSVRQSITFTYDSSWTSLKLACITNNTSQATNKTVTVSEIQFELGSATAYSPYSNICPITGRTGLSVYDDPKYGGTVAWNQLVENGNFASTTRWAVSSGDSLAVSNNKAVYRASARYHNIVQGTTFTSQEGHVYFGLVTVKGYTNTGTVFYIRNVSGGTVVQTATKTLTTQKQRLGNMIKVSANGSQLQYMFQDNNTSDYGDIELENAQLFDLTAMFGSTIADYIYSLEQADAGAGVAWFRNLFPKDYYPYDNSYTETCVSAVNGDPYRKKDIDWTSEAGTVYGGTLDVVTGVLTVTYKKISLGDYNYGKSADNNFYISTVTDFKVYGTGTTRYGVGLCDSFDFLTWNWASQNSTCTCYYNSGYNGYRIFFHSEEHANDSAAGFKTYMQSIGASFVYELATPLTYQLTGQEVEALVGTNNVWSDGGNVTVAVVTPETLTNNGRAVVPTLTASADMVLKWGNYSASVQQGTSTIPQLILENGANLIYIIGTGSISFTWQEASL